jgi:hypothetical protein
MTMTTPSTSWIAAAEAAIEGRDTSGFEVDVLERVPPPVFDVSAVRALSSPLLAGFMWAATVLREQLTQQPLDGLALLLRVLALALSVRALLALHMLWQRLRVRAALHRHALALTDEGLFYRDPSGDVVIPREHVLEAREEGDWRERSGRRWAHVHVVTAAESGRTHLSLPPVFLATSGVLAERLMRWLAQTPVERPAFPPLDEALPSKLWDRLRAGERPAGVTVLLQGSSWLQRGPYVSILLGLAALSGYARVSPEARAAIGMVGPLALVIALGVIPLVWLWLMRRELAVRGGLSLVLTPTEALLRTRAGIHRVRWQSVTAVEAEGRAAWSLVRGATHERSLVLRRPGDGDLRYQEAFLGAPLEVAIAHCEAYWRACRRELQGSEPSTPASNGSGAGGGTSSEDGTNTAATTRTP